jgi:acetylglutamate kinase
VSPVSRGPDGHPLNVNADEAAIALARELGADRLLLVSDVPGVLADGQLLPSLTESEADELAAQGVISGGMNVKVTQALSAAAAGVEVRIGDEGLLSGAPGTWIRGTHTPASSAKVEG